MTIYTSILKNGAMSRFIVALDIRPDHTVVVLNGVIGPQGYEKTGAYCPIRYEIPPSVMRRHIIITPPHGRKEYRALKSKRRGTRI